MAQSYILKRFGFTALVAIIVARLSPSLNFPCRLTGPDGQARDRQWLGSYGERVAAAWLRANRCKILARNFRNKRRGRRTGEVDIIARDGRLLLFVEVKTRHESSRIRPLAAVNKEKQRLIERGANDWLRRLGTRQLPWRFDVIEVFIQDGKPPRVKRVRDAF
jgi:putative endonuclease